MTDESDPLTDDEKRREELLRAGGSTEADAAPRIETSEHDGVTRIDIAETAAVRPGPGPGTPEADSPPPRDADDATAADVTGADVTGDRVDR